MPLSEEARRKYDKERAKNFRVISFKELRTSPLLSAIDSASQALGVSVSEYVRRATIEKLRSDGYATESAKSE